MKVYFQIQWQIINRHLQEVFGLHLQIARAFTVISFTTFSYLLLSNYQYAEYVYILFPIFISTKLANIERQQFLKICFGSSKCLHIRVVENLIISLPFIIFLIVFQHYLIAVALIGSAFALAYFNFTSKFNFVLPTPFQRHPFEFTAGFRKTFFVVFAIFALSLIAAVVDNYYLGLFPLIIGFLTTLSYYTNIEDEVWVWVHPKKPKGFLMGKVKVALLLNSLLYLPSTLILLCFFYENIVTTLALYLVGNASLLLIIFAKYTAFPLNIDVKEGIVIALGIYFPPLLIAIIPYFYIQSLKSLSRILK